MSVDLDTATRYRQHAEVLRVIACDSSSQTIRTTLLKIADDYDRMASSLEAVDTTNRALAARYTKNE